MPDNKIKRSRRVKKAKSKNVKYKNESDAQRAMLPTYFNNYNDSQNKGSLATKGDSNARRLPNDALDMLTTEVERFMIRGITNESRLKDLLNIRDVRVIQGCIRRVKSRWSIMGSAKNRNKMKGELLARMAAIAEDAWSIAGSEHSDNKEKLAALKLITDSYKFEASILGLGEHGDNNPSGGLTPHDSSVVDQLSKRKEVHDIFKEFKGVLDKNRKQRDVIEHE